MNTFVTHISGKRVRSGLFTWRSVPDQGGARNARHSLIRTLFTPLSITECIFRAPHWTEVTWVWVKSFLKIFMWQKVEIVTQDEYRQPYDPDRRLAFTVSILSSNYPGAASRIPKQILWMLNDDAVNPVTLPPRPGLACRSHKREGWFDSVLCRLQETNRGNEQERTSGFSSARN